MALINSSVLSVFFKVGLDNKITSIKSLQEFVVSFRILNVLLPLLAAMSIFTWIFALKTSVIFSSTLLSVLIFYISSYYRVIDKIILADIFEYSIRPVFHLLLVAMAIGIRGYQNWYLTFSLLFLVFFLVRMCSLITFEFKLIDFTRINFRYFLLSSLGFFFLRMDLYTAREVFADELFNNYLLISKVGIPVTIYVNASYWVNRDKEMKLKLSKIILSLFVLIMLYFVYIECPFNYSFIYLMTYWFFLQFAWGPVGLRYFTRYGTKYRVEVLIASIALAVLAWLFEDIGSVFVIYSVHFITVLLLYYIRNSLCFEKAN